MAEREYYDLLDWQNAGGLEGTGQKVEANPYVYQTPLPTVTAPTPPTGSTTPTPTGGGGGKTPQQIEAEGRAYDAAHGLFGGYMNGNTWVNGSPRVGPVGGGDDPSPNPFEMSGDGADFDPSTYQWTQFNPSPYGGYEDYRANPFIAPDPEATANDPWLNFALKKGTQQLENSAAYAGMVRSGMNKKNVLEHGVNFTRQFGNDVWNRALQGWQANEDNRFRAWGGNRQNSLDTYNTNYRGQADSFAGVRGSETMDFNARLQQWRDRLNSATQIASAGLGQ